MENPKNPTETEIDKKTSLNKWELVGFAWELGYIIALPVLVLALGGKWLDTHFGHEFPWVTLIGIALAIFTTTIWLTRRLKRYIK